MMKNIIFIIAIISVIIISCDTSTDPSTNLQIFPLNEGNIWIYQNYSVNNKDSLIKNSLDSIRVIKDTTINNFKFYYVNYLGTVIDLGYINDSLFTGVHPNYQYLKPYPLYNFPVKNNDFYSSDFGLCSVENIDTLISIHLGNFHCIQYKFFARNELGVGFNHYHYCSPGIGLIKIEKYNNSYSNQDKYIKTWETELISFKIQ